MSLFKHFLWVTSALFVCLTAPSCDDKKQEPTRENRINLVINDDCSGEINYAGSDVYGYKLDDKLKLPSLEIGGHPYDRDADFSIDFLDNMNEITTGTYYTSGVNRKCWLVYRPTANHDEVYVSMDSDSTAKVEIEKLSFYKDSTVNILDARFHQVKMVFQDDTICASGSIRMDWDDD